MARPSARQASEASGDRERLDDYFEKSEPRRIVVLLKERNSEGRALAKFQVNDSDPPQVTRLEVQGIFAGAAIIGFDIDAATRARVINGAIAKLLTLRFQDVSHDKHLFVSF